MHFRWLPLKNVRLLDLSLKFRKNSIFIASSDSFNVKNDNIYTPFFTVLVANFEFAGFAPKQKIHGLDRFHGNGPYCKILTEKEPIRAEGFA